MSMTSFQQLEKWVKDHYGRAMWIHSRHWNTPSSLITVIDEYATAYTRGDDLIDDAAKRLLEDIKSGEPRIE